MVERFREKITKDLCLNRRNEKGDFSFFCENGDFVMTTAHGSSAKIALEEAWILTEKVVLIRIREREFRIFVNGNSSDIFSSADPAIYGGRYVKFNPSNDKKKIGLFDIRTLGSRTFRWVDIKDVNDNYVIAEFYPGRYGLYKWDLQGENNVRYFYDYKNIEFTGRHGVYKVRSRSDINYGYWQLVSISGPATQERRDYVDIYKIDGSENLFVGERAGTPASWDIIDVSKIDRRKNMLVIYECDQEPQELKDGVRIVCDGLESTVNFSGIDSSGKLKPRDAYRRNQEISSVVDSEDKELTISGFNDTIDYYMVLKNGTEYTIRSTPYPSIVHNTKSFSKLSRNAVICWVLLDERKIVLSEPHYNKILHEEDMDKEVVRCLSKITRDLSKPTSCGRRRMTLNQLIPFLIENYVKPDTKSDKEIDSLETISTTPEVFPSDGGHQMPRAEETLAKGVDTIPMTSVEPQHTLIVDDKELDLELQKTFTLDIFGTRKAFNNPGGINYFMANGNIMVIIDTKTADYLDNFKLRTVVLAGQGKFTEHQYIGKNINAKIVKQNERGTRIVVFKREDEYNCCFYDELQYLSYSETKNITHHKDVILFHFLSLRRFV